MPIPFNRNQIKRQCIKYYAPLLLSVVIVSMFVPLLTSASPLIVMDHPVWFSIIHILRCEILPEQGWFWGIVIDRVNAGFTWGHIYSLNLLSIFLLNKVFILEMAVKIFLLICVIVFVLAFYIICNRFMTPFFALISAFFIIPKIFPTAVGEGIGYTHLALGLSLFFWVTSLKFIENFKVHQWIIAVLLFTMSIYAHPLGAISSFVIWISLLITLFISEKPRTDLKLKFLYVFIPCIGLLLAGPQVYAMLFANLKMHSASSISMTANALDTFGWKDCLRSIIEIIYPAMRAVDYVLFFGVIGMVVLWKKESQHKLPAFGLGIMGLFLTSRMILLFPLQQSLTQGLAFHADRFILLIWTFFFIIVGIGLNYLRSESKNIELSIFSLRGKAKVFGILIMLFPLILCLGPLGKLYFQRHAYFNTLETFEKKGDLFSLWDWINENVDRYEGRVFFEDTLGTYPWVGKGGGELSYNHVLALTSVYTYVNQVGGWVGYNDNRDFYYNYHVGKGGVLFGDREPSDLTESLIKERLKLLNCRYIIANSPAVKDYLDGVTLLKKIQSIGEFNIYEYKKMLSAWAYKKNGRETITFEKVSSRQYKISVNGRVGESVIISLAYNPNWLASHRSDPVPIRNHKALMEIDLPTSGFQIIDLEYRIEKTIPYLMLCGGLFLFIAVAVGVYALPDSRIKTVNSKEN